MHKLAVAHRVPAALAVLALSSGVRAEPITTVRLGLPLVSGLGFARSDAPGDRKWHGQRALGGVGLEVDVAPWLATEARLDLWADGSLPRFVAGLHAGPRVVLWDGRAAERTGSVVAFLGMAGLGYRSQEYNWLHGDSWGGRQMLTVDVVPALSWTAYTRPGFGWNLRLRAGGSFAFYRKGDASYYDGDSGEAQDGFRFGAFNGIDGGISF